MGSLYVPAIYHAGLMLHRSLMAPGFYSDIATQIPHPGFKELNLGRTPLQPRRDGRVSSVRLPDNAGECQGDKQALEIGLSDKEQQGRI